MKQRAITFIATCLLASPACAIRFIMPLQCDYGRDCFIQNYVEEADHQDYHCGKLTYPGHKGTDFRLTGFAAMQHGVNVVAASDGTVLRLRNNAPDTGIDAGRDSVAAHECGNGVVIAHTDGYETQYCHMQQGSIAVHPGEVVKAGDVLGHVGYSGFTAFPHVHFQVTHNGDMIDPFNAATPMASARCSSTHVNLWQPGSLPYIDTAMLNAGISTRIPRDDYVAEPLLSMASAPVNSPLLTLWVEAMGLQPGDILNLQLLAPDGSILVEDHAPIAHFKAEMFHFIGKKFHAPLAPGTYLGKASITRNSAPLPGSSITRELVVRAQ